MRHTEVVAEALPGFLGSASAAPNDRVGLFLVAPLNVGLQPGHVGPCGVTGLHCATRPECSRFYQIGSAAVGAGAEAVFFSRGASDPAAASSALGAPGGGRAVW